MIGSLVKKTNGKKTTATAIIYVALKLVKLKYPDLLHGHDEIVETLLTAAFSSSLLHKWYRNIKEYVSKKRPNK